MFFSQAIKFTYRMDVHVQGEDLLQFESKRNWQFVLKNSFGVQKVLVYICLYFILCYSLSCSGFAVVHDTLNLD